jgi:hypothetical protein
MKALVILALFISSQALALEAGVKDFLHGIEGSWKGSVLQKNYLANGDVREFHYEFDSTIQRLRDNEWVTHDRAFIDGWYYLSDSIFVTQGEAFWVGHPGQLRPTRVIETRAEHLNYEISGNTNRGVTVMNFDFTLDRDGRLNCVNSIRRNGKLVQTDAFVLTRY